MGPLAGLGTFPELALGVALLLSLIMMTHRKKTFPMLVAIRRETSSNMPLACPPAQATRL